MLSTRPKFFLLALLTALSLPVFNFSPSVFAEDASQEKFAFTILHSNDIHAHEDSYVEHGKNIGGMPRIAHLIKEAKKNNPRVLAVDAGDIFQGTAYFEQYKGETEVECLNKAGYDVYCIGNHEFDEGPVNLGKQLHLAKFDIIDCNLDVSGQPELKDLVKSSVIKVIDGQKVAFIGVITPALKELAPKLGDVKLISPGTNWMDPVKAEVQKMKEQGINKIVLVSHSGVDLEQLLGAIEGVDVVVGGHSHTRLDQPIVVAHSDGSKAMVVQTGSYGRALGRLDLVFDKEGKLVFPDSKYKLININDKVPEDKELKAYVTEKAKPFIALTKTVIAKSKANFEQRFKAFPYDSPIGDLVTDALFEASIDNGATIAIQNRGGIRAGFEAGPITLETVREILPFQNKLLVATITGKTLLAALEHSAGVVEGTGGRFLDVHGLKFAWDPTLPPGRRVLFAFAQNKEGKFESVQADELYRIAINDYTFNGGEGYDFKDAKDIVKTDLRLSTVVEQYLKKHKVISPAIPNRFMRVSSNIASKVSEGGKDKLNVQYALPHADVTVVSGSDVGITFLPKLGELPLQDPAVLMKSKTDDFGHLVIEMDKLVVSKPKGKGKSDSSAGKQFVSVIVQSIDKDGKSSKVISAPIQVR